MRNVFKEMSQIVDERIESIRKCKCLVLFAVAALAVLLHPPLVSATSILGSAQNFAVLGGSTVTNTGPTTITGDLGLSPGSSITNSGGLTLTGAEHIANDVANKAQTDVTTAYNGLAHMLATTNFTNQNLGGGQTLTSGVYSFSSSALLDGTLFLDAQFNNNAYWVFQIGSALTTASASSVQVINRATNNSFNGGLFWQVGSSATLGTGTTFEGNILALASITMETGATIGCGRALARNGAVTMDHNTISTGCTDTLGSYDLSGGLEFNQNGNIVPIGSSQGPAPVPEPSTILLLGAGLAGLVAFRKKFKKA